MIKLALATPTMTWVQRTIQPLADVLSNTNYCVNNCSVKCDVYRILVRCT